MDNVVKLVKPSPDVWVCNCGCSTFELMSDGTAVCAHCENAADGAGNGWLETFPDRKTDHEKDDTFRDVQGNGSVPFAKRRLFQLASDDTTCLVVIANRDGFVSAWRDGDMTEERLEWFSRRLDDARELIGRK